MMKLKSVDDVVLVLGGSAEAGRALAIGSTNISNWKRRNRMPANQYLAVNALLEIRDYQAGAELFAFRRPALRARRSR